MKTQAYIIITNQQNVKVKTIVVNANTIERAREGAYKAMNMPSVKAMLNKGYKAVIEG